MNKLKHKWTEIKEKFINGLTKEHKTAFIATVIFGLIAHMYKFTNTLPNYDSMFNYYNHQNIVSSGRWFLMLPCAFSSYFDLPWLIGVFCLFYIGLTAAIVVDLFKIKRKSAVILTAGLLVTFPAVTETMFFEYTADGYMFAMLIAAAAVWLTVIGRDKWYNYLFGAMLLCLCCGTYQAYLSFAMVLTLMWLIVDIINEHRDFKTYLKWILKQLGMYIVALASDFVIWKIMLRFWNATAYDYQGISGVGTLDADTIKNAFSGSIMSFKNFFVDGGIFSHRLSTYEFLNVVFVIVAGICIAAAIYRKKLWKRPANLALMIAAILLVPFATCIWLFTSSLVEYEPRMLQSICTLYIALIVITESLELPRLRKTALALTALIVFNFTVQANICYFYMQRSYENTYATATEMLARVHMVDNGEAEYFAVVGDIKDECSTLDSIMGATTTREISNLTMTFSPNLISEYKLTYLFMFNTFTFDYGEVLGDDYDELCENEEIAEMGIWPAADSVRQIGDTIVVKLSEP